MDVTSNWAVREAYHRCSNDLQMVVSLLQLSARRSDDLRTREALTDVANRVGVLIHARAALVQDGGQDLAALLRKVCEGLQAMGEPHGIRVCFRAAGEVGMLADPAVTAAGMAVNELVTNAIKHAFHGRSSGQVTVTLRSVPDGWVIITVDDDGSPLDPTKGAAGCSGHKPLGLDLSRRLLAAQGGSLVIPTGGSKCFEIRLPVQPAPGRQSPSPAPSPSP